MSILIQRTIAMNIITVTTLDTPGLEPYAKLTDAALANGKLTADGLFVAESTKVINVALDAGYEPVSLLTEEKHLYGYAHDLVERITSLPGKADMPIYTGPREVLRDLTGFTLTRSVLCAMRRKPMRPLEEVLRDAHLVAVIHGVCDTTNIGAIFRSAAALGVDSVVLTTDSCDPLNRRAIRVSMANIFLVPWTWLVPDNEPDTADSSSAVAQLQRHGFRTAAMALSDDSISLDDPVLKQQDRLAVIFGTEGDGLPHTTIAAADYVVRIPMSHQVDSLNVAAAAAVTFWELRRK